MVQLCSSPIGHLCRIKDFIFQGQLYVHLCRSLIESSKRKTWLDFKICGLITCFGLADFAMITGLRVSGDLSLLNPVKYHKNICRSKKSLFIADIGDIFESEYMCDNQSYVVLQLVFVYVVYTCVVMKKRKESPIELGYFKAGHVLHVAIGKYTKRALQKQNKFYN